MAPTTPPQGAVLRPTFLVGGSHKVQAGTAFVARDKSALMVLTAYHLVGPTGGLSWQVAPEGVGELVTLQARDLWTGRRVVKGVKARTLHYAASMETGALGADLMVFDLRLDAKGRAGGKVEVQSLSLAVGCPEEGESVWLLAQVSNLADQQLHAATVSACNEQELRYHFEAPWLNLQGTSGAPVLNRSGLVVGMHLGAPTGSAGRDGMGISVASIRAALAGQAPPEIQYDISTLDLELLHSELLVEWGLRGLREEEIRAMLSIDPELSEIFAKISELSWKNNMGNFEQIQQLVWRWNERYAQGGVPVVLMPVAAGAQLVLLAHRVLSELVVEVEGQQRRVQLVRRFDGVNVAEVAITRADGLDAVMVNVDAVRQDATLVWARIGQVPALDQELKAAIGEAHWASLRALAPKRRAAESSREQLNTRTGCSGFYVYSVPPLGPDPEMAETLSRYVGAGRCAAVREGERQALMATQMDASPAFDALAAHVLRGVVLEAALEGDAGARAALGEPSSAQSSRVRLCAQGKAGLPLAEQLNQELGLCGKAPLELQISPQLPWMPQALEAAD